MSKNFLNDVTLVLGVSAITSAITRYLKLPSVLGYMITGLIIGPYIPVPLFVDPHKVESLSQFGVILVMFAIGLEFRIKRFFQVLPTAGVTALLEMLVMGLLGISLGYLFNWSTTQSIFLGGAIAISSTMIVSKIFEENRPSKEIKEHVFGILVVQDILAIVLLTIFGTFAASSKIQLESILPTFFQLLFVLVISTAFGLFIVPRFIKHVAKLGSREVLTIVAIGTCFTCALAVEKMGYSVALGAFIAGVLVSESNEGHKVERIIAPLKDIFAAIFFVSVGLSVNPKLAIDFLPHSLLITFTVVFFQFFLVFLGGILSGAGLQKSTVSSLALGQIGEFAFIISSIGLSSRIIGAEFQAIIVTVAVLSSLCTPLLWKNSEKISNVILKRIPTRIRIAIGLYESWFKKLQLEAQDNKESFVLGIIPKKVIISLTIDIFLLIALPPILLSFLPIVMKGFIHEKTQNLNEYVMIITGGIVMSPILYGFVKNLSTLISIISEKLFSNLKSNSTQYDAASKLFSVTIWILTLFFIGPSIGSTLSPFISPYIFLSILVVLISLSLYQLWKRAGVLADNFESGGEKLVSVLKQQTYEKESSRKSSIKIPGMDDLEEVVIKNKKLANITLSEINTKTDYSITVVSIFRNHNRIHFPNQQEVIFFGDVLYIWGSKDAKKKFVKFINEGNTQ